MRIFIALASSIFMVLAIPHTASAQWIMTNGPQGGATIRCFTLMGSDLFAATGNGSIYRSTDHGATWVEPCSGYRSQTSIASLASDGNFLFYVDKVARVFRSTDRGASWYHVGTPHQCFPDALPLLTLHDTLLVGLGSMGIWRSTDHGTTWATALGGDSAKCICCLGVQGSTIWAGAYDGMLYRSSDRGVTWRSRGGEEAFGYGAPPITAIAFRGAYIYLGTYNGIFSSGDGGISWQSENLYNYFNVDHNILSLAASTTGLVGGTSTGAWYRASAGYWTSALQGLTRPPIAALVAQGETIFAGTSGSGIFKTINGGATWTASNSGIVSDGRVITLCSAGTSIYAGTQVGIFRSSDAGDHWIDLSRGLPDGPVTSVAATNSSIFALCSGYVGGKYMAGLFRSTNQGSNWAMVSFPDFDNGHGYAEYLQSRGTEIYLVASGSYSLGVYHSTDDGNTWTHSNTGLTSIDLTRMVAPSAELMFVGTSYSGVCRSTDNGQTWTDASNGLKNSAYWDPFPWISQLIIKGNDLYAATTRGVFRTTDQGGNWTWLTDGWSNPFVIGIATDGTNIYAATTENGVFRSLEANPLWSPANTGLSTSLFSSLTVHGNYVFVGGMNGGIWRRPISELAGIADRSESVPATFNLEQNYPNPFNPRTVVSSQLPVASHVRLAVYDLLGREVAVLVDERRAAGRYQDSFDGSGLASGVYICRMTAGTFVASRQMLLLK